MKYDNKNKKFKQYAFYLIKYILIYYMYYFYIEFNSVRLYDYMNIEYRKRKIVKLNLREWSRNDMWSQPFVADCLSFENM